MRKEKFKATLGRAFDSWAEAREYNSHEEILRPTASRTENCKKYHRNYDPSDSDKISIIR